MDIQSYPARIALGATSRDLIDLAKARHAFDPAVLDEHPPFFFPAEISSTRLDSYYTHMDLSTLRNFAADAEAGVSFQNSHNVFALGIGRVITGVYETTGDGARVVSDVYTIPGMNLGTVRTDDFILGVRSGVVKDVSVGFYGGRWTCDICGRDLLNWDCPHIPGLTYQVEGEDKINRAIVATALIEDAHLAEVSAVFDGATPSATILKAAQEADAGRLRPESARVLEARYRIHLPGARHVYPGVTVPPPPAAAQAGVEDNAMDLTEVRAVLTEIGQNGDDDILATLRALGSRVKALEEERARLASLADDGRAYRADLIEETLAEGVRAFGNDFPTETFRALLDGQGLDAIKKLLAHHRAAAARALPAGRQSVDDAPPPPPADPSPADDLPEVGIPNAAYRA